MKTKTYFAFRVDVWDARGDSIEQRRAPTSAADSDSAFGDAGSMSALPERGHGWAIYE